MREILDKKASDDRFPTIVLMISRYHRLVNLSFVKYASASGRARLRKDEEVDYTIWAKMACISIAGSQNTDANNDCRAVPRSNGNRVTEIPKTVR